MKTVMTSASSPYAELCEAPSGNVVQIIPGCEIEMEFDADDPKDAHEVLDAVTRSMHAKIDWIASKSAAQP